jgi:hypothetical protein
MLSSRDGAEKRYSICMPNAKLAQRISRRRRAITGSKIRSQRKKISVRRVPERFPPELQAPMTADVEGQLKQLVTKFGAEKVREALDPLITKCKWNDSPCVVNAIRRIAREK